MVELRRKISEDNPSSPVGDNSSKVKVKLKKKQQVQDVDGDIKPDATPIVTTDKVQQGEKNNAQKIGNDKSSTSQPSPKPQQSVDNSNGNLGNNQESAGISNVGSGKAKWIAAVIIAIALIGGGYFYLSNKNDDGQSSQIAQMNDQADNKANTEGKIDSTAKASETSGQSANTDNVNEQGDGSNSATAGEDIKNIGNGTTEAEPVSSPDRHSSSVAPASRTKAESHTTKSEPSTDNKVESHNVSSSSIPSSTEEAARQVIRGAYGNGSERKKMLGNRYEDIQRVVNDMYRTGKVQ